jgi:hypothetical protein
MMSWEEIVTYFNSGGWPLRCPQWVEMPSTKYFRYTRDTVVRGMLNDRTTSEMECPICLAPTIMPRSNSDNSRRLAMSRLAGVQPDSQENASQLILLWAFPSRQGTVAPLKNKFTYCYTMTFGTYIYIYVYTKGSKIYMHFNVQNICLNNLVVCLRFDFENVRN